MTYPDGVQVDAAGLRRVADTVEQVSTAVGRAHSSRRGELPVPAAAGEGWTSAAATRTATEAWGSFVGTLAGSVRTLGDELRSAADSYRASDEAAATRMPVAGGVPR